jgi:hypothetical protein
MTNQIIPLATNQAQNFNVRLVDLIAGMLAVAIVAIISFRRIKKRHKADGCQCCTKSDEKECRSCPGVSKTAGKEDKEDFDPPDSLTK